MTLVSGFAQGYADSSKIRQEHEYNQQDMKMRYALEDVMKEKDFRRQKAYEDSKYQSSAVAIAKMTGLPPEAAPELYTMLRNGVPASNIIEGVGNGTLSINPDYKAPAKTAEVQPGSPLYNGADTPQPGGTVGGLVPNAAAPGYKDPTVSAPNYQPTTDAAAATPDAAPNPGVPIGDSVAAAPKSSTPSAGGSLASAASAVTPAAATAAPSDVTPSPSTVLAGADNSTVSPAVAAAAPAVGDNSGVMTPPKAPAAPAATAAAPSTGQTNDKALVVNPSEPAVPPVQGDTSTPAAAPAPKQAAPMPKGVQPISTANKPHPKQGIGTAQDTSGLYSTGDPKQDAALDKMDPNLRRLPQYNQPVTNPQNTSGAMLQWKNKNGLPLQDMATLQDQLTAAIQSKDPNAIAVAKRHVDSAMLAQTIDTAKLRAANGKDTNSYFQLDDNNNVIGTFQGRLSLDGQSLTNISGRPGDPNSNKVVTGKVVMATPEDMQQYAQMHTGLRPNSDKLATANSYYIAALDAGSRIKSIIDDPTTRSAGFKYGGGFAQWINTASGEVTSITGTIESLGKAVTSGQSTGEEAMKDASVVNNKVIELSQKIAADPHIDKVAAAHIMYEASRTQVAMNLAAARQLGTERQPTEQSLNVMYDTLGGEDANPNKILPALHNALSEGYSILESQRAQLGNNPDINDFERMHSYGGQPIHLNMMGKDYETGAVIDRMNAGKINGPQDAARLKEMLGYVQRPYDDGQAAAAAVAKGEIHTGPVADAPAPPGATPVAPAAPQTPLDKWKATIPMDDNIPLEAKRIPDYGKVDSVKGADGKTQSATIGKLYDIGNGDQGQYLGGGLNKSNFKIIKGKK